MDGKDTLADKRSSADINRIQVLGNRDVQTAEPVVDRAVVKTAPAHRYGAGMTPEFAKAGRMHNVGES